MVTYEIYRGVKPNASLTLGRPDLSVFNDALGVFKSLTSETPTHLLVTYAFLGDVVLDKTLGKHLTLLPTNSELLEGHFGNFMGMSVVTDAFASPDDKLGLNFGTMIFLKVNEGVIEYALEVLNEPIV